MKIQIETGIYNERRYGKPWIAKVEFVGGKSEFKFGAWIGSHGSSGILEIQAEPGDVIARGQKDNRGNPRNSAPDYYIIDVDGVLRDTDKPAAYRHYESRKSAQPDSVALMSERDRLLKRLAEIDTQLIS